jgi:hypothetical protein
MRCTPKGVIERSARFKKKSKAGFLMIQLLTLKHTKQSKVPQVAILR